MDLPKPRTLTTGIPRGRSPGQYDHDAPPSDPAGVVEATAKTLEDGHVVIRHPAHARDQWLDAAHAIDLSEAI